jgi:hypothetical protein
MVVPNSVLNSPTRSHVVVWLWVGIETGWYVPVIHSIGEDVGLVVGWLCW